MFASVTSDTMEPDARTPFAILPVPMESVLLHTLAIASDRDILTVQEESRFVDAMRTNAKEENIHAIPFLIARISLETTLAVLVPQEQLELHTWSIL